LEEAAPLRAETPHQIKDGINDSPRQVATQRPDDYRADFFAASISDTE
jgi:hypothetical protein